jgi:hypothetical protein
MSRITVSASIRRLVIERAGGRCEYCLLHQDDTPFTHQIDHLIPIKHGGETIESNLALACLECNRHKGSDLTAIDPTDGSVVLLFNPRTQLWQEHFTLVGVRIAGQTPAGRATVILLRMNEPTRIIQRQVVIDTGRYTTP